MGIDREGTCDVVIQGAGIAGLTLAISLAKSGFSVRVLERCLSASEAGAGIWMATNAMQVFDRLGIAESVRAAGWPIRRIRLQDARGFELQETDLSEVARDFGFETVALHRLVLQRVLLERVDQTLVDFGMEAVEILRSQCGPIILQLSNGTTLRTQVFVGADGINSAVRRLTCLGGERRYSGSSSYRAIARSTRLLPLESEHDAYEIWGRGCRIGFSQINAQDTYWYMTFDCSANRKTTTGEQYAHAASLFKTQFPSWVQLLDNTRPQDILRTDIADLRPLSKWSSGNVGLIGDAAHASTPNLGQGGAMAVEDALALTESFVSAGLGERAWIDFEARRRAKVDWSVSTSRTVGRLCHMSHPVSRALRNIVLRSIPKQIANAQLRKICTLS